MGGPWLAAELGEVGQPRVAGVQFALAICDQQHDRGIREITTHEAQQQQGWLVGCMQVIEDR